MCIGWPGARRCSAQLGGVRWIAADGRVDLRAVEFAAACPADGTLISTVQDGRVYRIAGGASLYVSTWSAVGGPQPTVAVDQWDVDNTSNPAAHLLGYPADGTLI